MTLISLLLALIFLYSLVSARLEKAPISAPMVFTLGGAIAFVCFPDLGTEGHSGARIQSIELFQHLAEIGLVLLLFTDASRTDLSVLGNIRAIPARLLSTGMLLTIGLGAAFALGLLPQISVWEAFIIASILAPTDAGLGQVIVNDVRVPLKVRQALNVEAGLNDGLSVPFLLFFVALEANGATPSETRLWHFIVEQLIYGSLVGIGLGLVGGWLLGIAHRQDWIAKAWQPLAVVSLPLLALILSEHVHASMFIASFVAGLSAQVGFKGIGKHSVQFAEDWGQLINLSVFMLFGFIVARAWGQITALHFIYGVASLTIVRMLPVAIALWGTGLSRPTVLFMGWFGPRGLASIVLALVYLTSIDELADQTIKYAVMATVLLSIFAHGISAMPLMKRYAGYISGLQGHAPELKDS